MQPVAEFVKEFLNVDKSERTPAEMLIGQIAVNALSGYFEEISDNPQALADKTLENEIAQKHMDKMRGLLKHLLDVKPSLEQDPAFKSLVGKGKFRSKL